MAPALLMSRSSVARLAQPLAQIDPGPFREFDFAVAALEGPAALIA
jgi:hypothetical protein